MSRPQANAIALGPSVGWGRGRGRIAIAGAGARIVLDAHIPSYRRLGVDIDLIFDPDPGRLELAAAAVVKTGGATRAIHDRGTFLATLRDADLDLMDVAVPSPVHTAFLNELFDDLGQDCPHLLVQKPLAENSDAARGLVARAGDLDVRMLMQMNGRWVPTFRKLRDVVRSGALGDIQVVEVLNRGLNPKTADDWRSRIDRLIGYEMAIHHVDLLIWMFGPPDWVFAAHRNVPGFVVEADNFAVMTMGFGENLVANVVENWTCRVEEAWSLHPKGEHVVVSGARGTAFATPHRLTIASDGDSRTYTSEMPWFPDAFGGPMEEALNALREGRPSDIDGAGHLALLNVLDCLYRSASERKVVAVK